MKPAAGTLCLWLSACVAPGVGQLAQRRWAAGLLFLALFLGAVGGWLWTMLPPLLAYFQWLEDLLSGRPATAPAAPRLGAVLAWSGLALAVYVGGVADTWAAWQRRRPLPARVADRARPPASSGPDAEC